MRGSAPAMRASSAGVPHGADAALAQDGDTIGQTLGLVEVVGGEHDRLAQGTEVLDRGPAPPPRLGVEAGRGLVEEDQLGVPGQRQREVEAAALPAREPPDDGVALGGQLDDFQELVERARRPVEGPPRVDQLAAPVGAAGKPHSCSTTPVRSRSSGGWSAGSKPRTRTVPARSGGRKPSRISSVVVLPAPLGPRRPNTSPRATREVDAPQHRPVAVALAETLDDDGRSSLGNVHVSKIRFRI